MFQRWVPVVAAVVLSLIASTALAECGCGPAVTTYAPAAGNYTLSYTPAVTYVAPESYVAYSAPAASYVSYYAPAVQPYVAYSAPVTSYVTAYAPTVQPYVAYSAPVTPYVSYYPAVVRQPYAVRYGVPGASIYGTGKVYVPGEPVRNFFRAVTP